MSIKNIFFYFVIINLIMFQGMVYGQPRISDKAIYRIVYQFVYSYDTTSPDKKMTEIMNLYIGQLYSDYRNANYERVEIERQKRMELIKEQMNNQNMSSKVTGSGEVSKIPQTELFKQIGDPNLYRKEIIAGRNYLIQELLPQIVWTIDSETKILGNIKCQKAHGVFRGRLYNVWFTLEYPIPVGPWKLSGLPGIILEASDERKEVVFSFVRFDILKETSQSLFALPPKYDKVKASEFERLQNLFMEDPIAFINNRRQLTNINVSVNGKSLEEMAAGQPLRKNVKSPINNPIELEKD